MDYSSELAGLAGEVYSYLLEQVVAPLKWSELESNLLKRHESRDTRSLVVDVLPILTCLATGGDRQTAIPVAAGWLLYNVGGRVFDDLYDNEGQGSVWQANGRMQAMNLALTAVALAQAAFSDLERAALPVALRVARQCGYALATAAQSQTEQVTGSLPTEKQYFENLFKKTGNFVGTAAWAGASLGTQDKTLIDAAYQFGLTTGIMAQIYDDCHDLEKDISADCYTLPVICAAAATARPQHQRLLLLLDRQSQSTEEKQEFVDLVRKIGGVSQATAVAHLYRAQALDALSTFPDGQPKEYLRDYVNPI
jgi:octaprenyl-diphosphate synthase